jgi:hypothetical protein
MAENAQKESADRGMRTDETLTSFIRDTIKQLKKQRTGEQALRDLKQTPEIKAAIASLADEREKVIQLALKKVESDIRAALAK